MSAVTKLSKFINNHAIEMTVNNIKIMQNLQFYWNISRDIINEFPLTLFEVSIIYCSIAFPSPLTMIFIFIFLLSRLIYELLNVLISQR